MPYAATLGKKGGYLKGRGDEWLARAGGFIGGILSQKKPQRF
jgi:hypothetical protein